MTVKDVWETEGCVTTSGAPELRDHVPTQDAVTVARLRAAGAVIAGKTNTPLYAGDNQTFNEVFGQTNNPWDVTRTTGGSSGGSAAAVAAGMSSLELGSDIGGSIRAPAHFCGVYGLKPSWGLVPSRGHIPGPPGNLIETDVNSGGPLARSVADLRLGLDVLAGPLEDDAVAWTLDLPDGPTVDTLSGLRLGVMFTDDDYPVAREVQDVLRALAARLSDADAKTRGTATARVRGRRLGLVVSLGIADHRHGPARRRLRRVLHARSHVARSGHAIGPPARVELPRLAPSQRPSSATTTGLARLLHRIRRVPRADHAGCRVPTRQRTVDTGADDRHRRH